MLANVWHILLNVNMNSLWELCGAAALSKADEEEAAFRQKLVCSARDLYNCWEHELRTFWAGPFLGTDPQQNPHTSDKAEAHSSNVISGTKRGQKQTLECDRFESLFRGLAVLRDCQSPGGLPKYVQWAWRMRDGQRLRV